MRLLGFLLKNKGFILIVFILLIVAGLSTSPFKDSNSFLPKNSVAVDIIPNLGDNQQIIFTEWPGYSPQNIEDQITYPLTSYLLGIPNVKSLRSNSIFGVSSIYVIFDDNIDFYWSRTRLLEKLASLPSGLLPMGVKPELGPDATALGQIYWYTLEGRDSNGSETGGWSLQEVRTIQDFYVKTALAGIQGVSEVASVGGHLKEYQIDVDPQKMIKYNISLDDIVKAARNANFDTGAKTLEINKIEYFVRGLGQISSIADIEQAVVKINRAVPLRIADVAMVTLGPAERRGILDKNGAEVVGGVITARFGENPMEVIHRIRDKLVTISKGLPSKKLKDGTISKLTIVPFYDRGELIKDTLHTLESAIRMEILITIFVILFLLKSLRVSIIISSLMPMVVLFVFASMKIFKIDANIVSLSGIAIAIGTVVDMGIIVAENVLRKLRKSKRDGIVNKRVISATGEVSGAIFTAGLTTVLSFVPVFMLTGMEGKLFSPLVFTKTMAIIGAIIMSLTFVPIILAFSYKPIIMVKRTRVILYGIFIILLLFIGYSLSPLFYLVLPVLLVNILFELGIDGTIHRKRINRYLGILAIILLLGYYWRPLGPASNLVFNVLFVLFVLSIVLLPLRFFMKKYEVILEWALNNKIKSLSVPITIVFLGLFSIFSLKKEFMPKLNEGDFILMPSSLPYTGITEINQTLKLLDRAVSQLPEVEYVVGKAGRVESALDPAPLSMYENLVSIKPEYALDEKGALRRFKTNGKGGFITKKGDTVSQEEVNNLDFLIPDKNGEYFRNWRGHIKNRDDIWREITANINIPTITRTPKLQPVETRLVMLQTGMRSDLGIKVFGDDILEIESFSLELEKILREVPGIIPNSVFAERTIGKPYLIIKPNRTEIARYGLSINEVLEKMSTAVGGKTVTETFEGRERYKVRLRYPRELRNSPDEIARILISTPLGSQVPLNSLAKIDFEQGPQSIKGEDGFLVNYVTFDKSPEMSDLEIVKNVRSAIETKTSNLEISLPKGVSYEFAGSYENHIRSNRTLMFLIPLVVILIFLILYIQFRSISISIMVLSGVTVAFSGGAILLWLYGQDWFLNLSWERTSLREFLNIADVNLSLAVWIGFLALFGIATDDGVLIATYLRQNFKNKKLQDQFQIRSLVIATGKRRIKACIMTTATTILALLPVLISNGKGSEIMIPMAIPCFGGMLMALITLFVVPILYCWKEEIVLKKRLKHSYEI